MNIRKLLIAEAEKKDILRQYGLITEAANSEPIKTLEVDVTIKFTGGYYSAAYANFKGNLDPQLSKVTQFLKNGQGKAYLVNVDITSSESRLPNVDNEKKLPNGKGTPVLPKFLSEQRSKTIKDYIDGKLKSYVEQKLLLAMPNIKVKAPAITGPKWIGQPFCPAKLVPADDPQGYICSSETFNPGNDASGVKIVNWYQGKGNVYASLLEEYKTAQNMTVKLKLEELTDMKKCLDGMVIEVNYTNLAESHVCNNAVYHIYLTGGQQPKGKDILYRDGDKKNYASLNNKGQYDNNSGTCKGDPTTDQSCKRYNKFTITPEMATQVLTQSFANLASGQKPSFTIWAQCSELNTQHQRWGTGCHASEADKTAGVGDVVITNGLKEKTTFTVKTPVTRAQIKPLKTINACGK
jgi:hypothetical protein